MTPTEYFVRWLLVGAAFLVLLWGVLYVTVTRHLLALLAALERMQR